MKYTLLLFLLAFHLPMFAQVNDHSQNRQPEKAHPGPGRGDRGRDTELNDRGHNRIPFRPLIVNYRGQRFSSHYANRIFLKRDLLQVYGRGLNLESFPLQRVEVFARPVYGNVTITLEINGFPVGTRSKSSFYRDFGPLVFYVNPWQARGPWQLVVNQGELFVERIVFFPENRPPRRPRH
ncbi:MAG: hypothetical protein H6622_09515 [Halobacteriovoraceae bacterium]|nr:hypothetical protein [Halobacteriovoraceae bacterium]